MAKRKAANKPATDAKPRQRSMIWLQGLLCGAMVTLATPTALLLGVLLGPALLAIALDREPGRPRARGIALWSMAAAIIPLRTLWITGHSMATAIALLSDLQNIAMAWSAAAGGWLLAEGLPIAVRATLEALSIARTARLRSERNGLVEAWGLESPPADQ